MDTNANRQVGCVLRAVRVAAGLTQVKVAEQLGVPQSYISKLESGERSLRVAELFAYAVALEVDAHELVDEIQKALVAG